MHWSESKEVEILDLDGLIDLTGDRSRWLVHVPCDLRRQYTPEYFNTRRAAIAAVEAAGYTYNRRVWAWYKAA